MTFMETKTGLPYSIVTVLVAISEGKELTEDGVAEAKAVVRLGLGYVEASSDAPSGFVVTEAGREKLSKVCNRCGRLLSPNGHCHPCAEDKLLLERSPSAVISMHNAFGNKP